METLSALGLFDFFVDHNNLNTFELDYVSATVVQSKNRHNIAKVYGTTIRMQYDRHQWDMAGSDFESGVSEAASTMYYFYLKENGDRIISDIAPYDRRGDLRGFYHPYETWRYIGACYNDSSSDLESGSERSAPENQKTS